MSSETKRARATTASAADPRPARRPSAGPAPSVRRRVVLVHGGATDPAVEAGDLAVLDRKSIGRNTLTRLVERLDKAGAAGLVLNDDVLTDLPLGERRALAERLPLLVLGPEHASTVLLEPTVLPPADRAAAALRGVLRGEPASADALPPELDLAAPTRALVVVAGSDDGRPPPPGGIEDLVAAEARAADPRALVVELDGGVVALVHDYDDGAAVETAGRAILRRARAVLSSVTVGIGRSYPGRHGLRRAYREALWAATASELLWGTSRVTTFRDLGIYGMLEPFVADPESADTADVERILEHDRDSGGALLPTLETFFRTCSVGQTASELFVHRNTVTYRLRAVSKITDLDVLGDPDAKVHLEVQLRLARLRRLLPVRDKG